MIALSTVDKLGHHKRAYALALRCSAELVERGVFLWGPGWESPALVAMNGEKCAGFIMYDLDPDVDYFEINLVCIDPAYRGGASVMILMLSKLRDIIKDSKKKNLRFLYHANNPYMKDAARIFGGHIRSYTVEMNVEDIAG